MVHMSNKEVKCLPHQDEKVFLASQGVSSLSYTQELPSTTCSQWMGGGVFYGIVQTVTSELAAPLGGCLALTV